MRTFFTRRRGSFSQLLPPVASLSRLAAIRTIGVADKTLIFVEETRMLYAFDRESTETATGTEIVAPVVGLGRWKTVGGGSSEPPPADHSLVHDTFTTDTVTVSARQQILVYEEFTIDPDTVLVLEAGGNLVVL